MQTLQAVFVIGFAFASMVKGHGLARHERRNVVITPQAEQLGRVEVSSNSRDGTEDYFEQFSHSPLQQHDAVEVPAQVDLLEVTRTPGNHFFGYFDKSPWSPDERLLLVGKTKFYSHDMTPSDVMEIGTVGASGADPSWRTVANTTAWNFQQGTMLQWKGNSSRHIIFNQRNSDEMGVPESLLQSLLESLSRDARAGGDAFHGVVLDVESGERTRLPRPVYALSPDGRWATSLNFLRLHVLRKGYGYVASEAALEAASQDPTPADDGLWIMDTMDPAAEPTLLLSLRALASRFNPGRMTDWHWVNHAQWSADGNRIVFLLRHGPKPGAPFETIGLFTVPREGSIESVVRVPHVHGSHHDFSGPRGMLLSCDDKAFVIYNASSPGRDSVQFSTRENDGHCTFNPQVPHLVLADTYPRPCLESHSATCPAGSTGKMLFVLDVRAGKKYILGQFANLGEGPEQCRSDLHPRWNRAGTAIAIDSTHVPGQGRQLFTVDVRHVLDAVGQDESTPGLGASLQLHSARRIHSRQGAGSPKKVFIDLGARDGDTIEDFIDKHQEEVKRGEWELWAFECNPDNMSPFHARAERLQQSYPALEHSLHLIQQAAWNSTGTLDFHTDTGNRSWRKTAEERQDLSGGSLFSSPYAKGKKVTVTTIDITDFLKKHAKIDDTVVLKMDIEGAEYVVLQKMLSDKEAASLVDNWIVEWHDGSNNPWMSPARSASLERDWDAFVKKSGVSYVKWH